MEKVLVTGGAGFIGSSLVRILLKNGYDVVVLDNFNIGSLDYMPKSDKLTVIPGDVRDYEIVKTIMKNTPIVVHLAAQAFIPLGYQLPFYVANINVNGSLTVFKAALETKVRRLIHISSGEVYGNAEYLPIDENHPIKPVSTYAAAKASADMFAQTMYFEQKLPVVILRPFSVYGPRATLPYIWPELIRQFLKEEKVRTGFLESKRDFMYVDDFSNAILKAIESEIIGETINIGSGKSWSMYELVELIREITGKYNKEIVIDKKRIRPVEVVHVRTDTKKAEKLLNWKAQIDIREGFKKTIEWYLKNNMTWEYERRGWCWRY